MSAPFEHFFFRMSAPFENIWGTHSREALIKFFPSKGGRSFEGGAHLSKYGIYQTFI